MKQKNRNQILFKQFNVFEKCTKTIWLDSFRFLIRKSMVRIRLTENWIKSRHFNQACWAGASECKLKQHFTPSFDRTGHANSMKYVWTILCKYRAFFYIINYVKLDKYKIKLVFYLWQNPWNPLKRKLTKGRRQLFLVSPILSKKPEK